ncbi:MAG: DNA polymerase Y family protein [Steroidobacteraceae bacterium]|nr:DNA polymerase Y family protein [Steroidobacteraceae bacterium]
MPRVVSLFLPNWPIDRHNRDRRALGPLPGQPVSGLTDIAPPSPEEPLILADRDGNRRIVFAANGVARDFGLRIGMPVTQAQALIPGLTIRDAEPLADRAGLNRLALWALHRYAPIVAADPPDGLVIDATGAAHLRGGEAPMLQDMIVRLADAGVAARAAMADSWGAAHALARFVANPIFVAPAGQSRDILLTLPIAALRLPPEMVARLRRLGFERIDDLAEQPRAPLALRFGPQLHRRLDQAFGTLAEAIEAARPPDLIEVRQNFVEPIGAAETIARYTGNLVAKLCAMLEAKGLGARQLDMVFNRVDAQSQAIRVGTAAPVRNVKHLTRMLCDKIETIDPGFGIEIMTLCAARSEPFGPKQLTSLFADEPETDISDLIDTIANRIGADRLYRFAPVASDVPERSLRRIAATAPPTKTNWPDHWPRPTRLLPNPEPIETVALLPDQPPVSFTWRGIRRRVKRADGPERIFGEWWKRDAELIAVRDYFQIEDDAGERFWVFRAGDGEDGATGSHRWFLHGIFG